METKIKIKVKIADRIYPLTIQPEQEEVIRSSVKKIDHKIETLNEKDLADLIYKYGEERLSRKI